MSLLYLHLPLCAKCRIYLRQYPWPDWLSQRVSSLSRWCCSPIPGGFVCMNCCYCRRATANGTSQTSLEAYRRRGKSYRNILEHERRLQSILDTEEIAMAEEDRVAEGGSLAGDYDIVTSRMEEGVMFDNPQHTSHRRPSKELILDDNPEKGGLGDEEVAAVKTGAEGSGSPYRAVTREEIDGINHLLNILQRKIETIEQLESHHQKDRATSPEKDSERGSSLTSGHPLPARTSEPNDNSNGIQQEIAHLERLIEAEIEKVVEGKS